MSVPAGPAAATDIALYRPNATELVHSSGSTATSTASLPMAQDQGGSERLRPAVRRGHLNAASVIPPVVPAVPPADGAVTP